MRIKSFKGPFKIVFIAKSQLGHKKKLNKKRKMCSHCNRDLQPIKAVYPMRNISSNKNDVPFFKNASGGLEETPRLLGNGRNVVKSLSLLYKLHQKIIEKFIEAMWYLKNVLFIRRTNFLYNFTWLFFSVTACITSLGERIRTFNENFYLWYFLDYRWKKLIIK